MKSYSPSNRFVFLPLLAVMLFSFNLSAQSESPVQSGHANVVGGPTVGPARAEIVPLFWKATISNSIVSVPLASVEYFGVQTYDVDSVARVRELTITTKSQSMVRIYHMTPLSSISDQAEKTIKALNGIAEGIANDQLNVPVKVFPSTTHAHMVEYRVESRGDIDILYRHLETAMKDYHARALVPEQRDQTVREVRITSEAK